MLLKCVHCGKCERCNKCFGCVFLKDENGTPLRERDDWGGLVTGTGESKVTAEPNQIKVGDVVRLKSGGQAMTVDAIDGCQTATCIYWDEEVKAHQIFLLNPLSLVKID